MADIKEQIAKLAAAIPLAKGQDHRVTYANSSRMGISPWDVRIIFGQVIEAANGTQVNEDQTTVVMAPALAKQVLKNLESTVAQYEELFGEIKDPMAKSGLAQGAQQPQQQKTRKPPKLKKLS